MAKHKICYIISNIDRWQAFEWVSEYYNYKKIDISFILLSPTNDTYFYRYLLNNNRNVHHVKLNGKRDYPKIIFTLTNFLRKLKPNVVHCHFLDAGITGLLVSYILGIRKRVYTRHHGYFHHYYHPKGVMYDKLCNRLATDLIAISDVVAQAIKKEKVNLRKIHGVHHGFHLNTFTDVDAHKVNQLKKIYNWREKSPVIAVVARHIEWKGIQYVVPAFSKLLNKHPNALLLLANARGDYSTSIDQQLKELPSGSYIKIPFEKDIQALYQLFDIYVHVPVNEKIEAFGQTYVEALAAGIPSIFTKSGIANDFVKDKRNALVVPFKDSNAIYLAILELLENQELCDQLVRNGKKDVEERFAFEKMMDKLDNIYFN